MPLRNNKGKNKNKNKNQNESRPNTRAHPAAVSDAGHSSSSSPVLLSPPRNDHLPSSGDNNNNKERVSTSSSTSSVSRDSLDNSHITILPLENIRLNKFERSQNSMQDNTNLRATLEVSDNTGNLHTLSPCPGDSSGTNPTEGEVFGNSTHPSCPSPPTDPLLLIYAELREMRAEMGKMSKLDTIESTTEGFSTQLQTLVNRTSALESSVSTNTTKINQLEQEIRVLKDIVSKQGEIISNVQVVKEDFTKTSKEAIDTMNELVETQRGQVQDFKESAKKLKVEAGSVADEKVGELSRNMEYNSLKDKAARNRRNLIILGLNEHPTNSTYSVVKAFFKNTLKLTRLSIDVAFRLGSAPPEGSSYNRPILVTFPYLADRNAVWRKRKEAISTEDQERIKIQADLPRKLREDIQLLYRVARAASKLPQYKTAMVRDYALILNGEEFTAQNLESLPLPIQPSSLAVAKSDDVLAFFSKHCELSNHYPACFTINDNTFHNVEQFLAFNRAKISDDLSLVEKALQTPDPVGAKSILNLLSKDHLQEWETRRQEIAMEALRAKFKQNKRLQSYLLGTGNLQLGEASRNKCWGVGLNLEDPNILDTTKWNDSGNLLGKMLMNVRQELHASLQN